MADLTPELLAQLAAIDGQPYNCEWREEYVQDRDESIICDAREEKEAGMIIAALNALPSLLAAAKERDQLRSSLAGKEEEIRKLSEMLGPSQIDRANLGDLVDQMRAEVERMRDLALDAVDVIEEATTPTNKLAAALRAQIERKP